MALTPLLEQLKSREVTENLSSLPVADYRGATVVARFSDPRSELSALQSGCGVYDLGFLIRTELTGKDRVRWLNGMVTNNIRDLAVGAGVYSFLLNPQGQIQGDLYAYKLDEAILLDTDRAQAENTLGKMKRYIIMDDVKMNSLGENLTAIGIGGPKSREVLIRSGIAIPETKPLEVFTPQCVCDCDCLECTVVRGDDEPHETYQIWIAPKDVGKLWHALAAAGATPVGSETLERQRILQGVPLFGVDIRERELPQETSQARALNFTKGCYIGQEIVERIRSRGRVNRVFTTFVFQANEQIPPGAKIVDTGKEVGEITSVTTFAGNHQSVALGYIRSEARIPNREVTIGEARATIAQGLLGFSSPAPEPALSTHS